MRYTPNRVWLRLSAALLLPLLTPVLAAQTLVVATAGQPMPNPVALNVPTTIALDATVTNPPTGTYTNPVTRQEWLWVGPGAQVRATSQSPWVNASPGTVSMTLVQPNRGSPAATVSVSFTQSGEWKLTFIANVSFFCANGAPAGIGVSQRLEVYVTVETGVSGITYHTPSTGTFAPAPTTLYILKGTGVTFKAVPTPLAPFPGGQPVWSGSSGATGAGDTTVVTFNTLSASATDYKTVTASAPGKAPVTVNVVVYDLTPTLTPVDNFAGRSTTTFGVCERISLSATVTPSLPSGPYGPLIGWRIVSGGGQLVGGLGTGGLYICPSAAGAFTLDCGVEDPAQRVQVAAGVVAPTGVTFIRTTKPNKKCCKHTMGEWSAGYKAEMYLLPKNVSFANIETKEQTCKGKAEGWLKTMGLDGEEHEPGGWAKVGAGNKDKGCQIQAYDTINAEVPEPAGGYPEFAAGRFYWDIDMKGVIAPFQRIKRRQRERDGDTPHKCLNHHLQTPRYGCARPRPKHG